MQLRRIRIITRSEPRVAFPRFSIEFERIREERKKERKADAEEQMPRHKFSITRVTFLLGFTPFSYLVQRVKWNDVWNE